MGLSGYRRKYGVEMMSRNEILASVRNEVTPTAEESEAMEAAAQELADRINSALAERGVDGASVTQTGSTARGTWVAGDRDIDLFIEFPVAMSDSEMESHGLAAGDAALPNGRTDYASHPYTKGEFRGFEIDIVPCFAVETAGDIRSAVDRTPFHTRFLEAELTPELQGDVRVAKKFLKGVDAYGSDVATEGFSGFLTELLVLEHDGFVPLLEAVSEMEPPVRFDPVGHGTETFSDTLVVIDPTDPERNVAANLSAEQFARFQHNARRFLSEPSLDFFESDSENETVLDRHQSGAANGMSVHTLHFPLSDDVVEDTLHPQLRKSMESISGSLNDRGFEVFGMHVATTETSVAMVFELSVDSLPAIERHMGPPVARREAAENFVSAHEDAGNEIRIEGSRFVSVRERSFTTAAEFLSSERVVETAALGPIIEGAFDEGEVTVSTDFDRLPADVAGASVDRMQ